MIEVYCKKIVNLSNLHRKFSFAAVLLPLTSNADWWVTADMSEALPDFDFASKGMVDRAALGGLIDTHYHRGVSSHGDLNLARDEYEAQIQSVIVRHTGPSVDSDYRAKFVSNLHGADLYLSVACASGSDPAWTRFRQLYIRSMSDQFLGLARRGRDSATEQADTLVSDLYLPDGSGRPRIRSYDGRSSLATWLHVIVNNRWINEHQKRRNELPLLSDPTELHSAEAASHVERHVLRGRYTEPALNALEQACLCLSPEERKILLWRYDNHLKLGEIADRMTLHQSNVTRQIAKICARIHAIVVETLIERHQLSADAAEECIACARGEITDLTSVIASLKKFQEKTSRS